MHFATFDFNLLYSNFLWNILKKFSFEKDRDFNNFSLF